MDLFKKMCLFTRSFIIFYFLFFLNVPFCCSNDWILGCLFSFLCSVAELTWPNCLSANWRSTCKAKFSANKNVSWRTLIFVFLTWSSQLGDPSSWERRCFNRYRHHLNVSEWGGCGKKLAAALEKHGGARPRVKKSSVLSPSAQAAKELMRVGRGRGGGSSGGHKEVVVTLSHKTAVRGTEAPTKCYFGAKRSHFAVEFGGRVLCFLGLRFTFSKILAFLVLKLSAGRTYGLFTFQYESRARQKIWFAVTKSKALHF